MIIIADSSCLIALNNIHRLSLLQSVFGGITITEQVALEFRLKLPDWVEVLPVNNLDIFNELKSYLDLGEASSIALALENPGSVLIIDELEGRKAAKKYAIRFTGTIGVIGEAKAMKLIPKVKPLIEDLKKVGFRMSDDLEYDFLKRQGELD